MVVAKLLLALSLSLFGPASILIAEEPGREIWTCEKKKEGVVFYTNVPTVTADDRCSKAQLQQGAVTVVDEESFNRLASAIAAEVKANKASLDKKEASRRGRPVRGRTDSAKVHIDVPAK